MIQVINKRTLSDGWVEGLKKSASRLAAMLSSGAQIVKLAGTIENLDERSGTLLICRNNDGAPVLMEWNSLTTLSRGTSGKRVTTPFKAAAELVKRHVEIVFQEINGHNIANSILLAEAPVGARG